MNESKLPKQLKRYRIERAWTQAQMANVLGLDRSAVCKMERGVYRWSPITVARLKKALPDLN